ncbi:MAG: hypothetical protein ACLSG5_01220 [Oscillospiraceae bacterium]
MEQKTNEIRRTWANPLRELKTATNTAQIFRLRRSHKAVPITYNAIQATYAAFCSTVKFVISAAGTLAFILKKNENEVMRYESISARNRTPRPTPIRSSEVGQNTMSLSVVSADGAEGKFRKCRPGAM